MNLKWNSDYRRFEVEFHNFTEEQPLIKTVGFKTDGPPAWVWYSIKSEPLTKLRENRPAVLNINADARQEYARLKEVEDRNAATKTALKEQQKVLKKKLNNDKLDSLKPSEYLDEALGFVCIIVKPNSEPWTSKFTLNPPPEITCFICGTPVYSYEYGENQTPSCLWCQKIVLDNATEVC